MVFRRVELLSKDYPYKGPSLVAVPHERKRLIDEGMLPFESSVAGFNERYHRGETSHTIHVWWARRPHSAMRSVVFASLCKDANKKCIDLMANLAMNPTSRIVEEARGVLLSQYANNDPTVLDMFGGGGTIPFEAKRLGCSVCSIDTNQLSVFIQKCNLQYPDQIDLEAANLQIEDSGERVLSAVKRRTDWLYPLRDASDESVFGYLWSYRTKCDKCGYSFLLSKRRWLSKKGGNNTSFVLENEAERQKAHIKKNCNEDYAVNWRGRTSTVVCPSCGHSYKNPNAMECADEVLATVSLKSGGGKQFHESNTQTACPSLARMVEKEGELLSSIGMELPSTCLPVWSGIVNPALYGIKTHSDFVNQRQRLLLLYLIDELLNEYKRLKSADEALAKFVIGMLSSLIDQVVDWNCRLSIWIPQNEQVGRAFCGPGVAMYWDYVETDQLLNGPANLWAKLKRISRGVSSMVNNSGSVDVRHASAQNLPFEDESFDAIVTDPPYYDNIYYSVLSDFFYAWKKPLLEKLEPELFQADATERRHELVASVKRSGSTTRAYEDYCEQLELAFSEAFRVLKDDGVFSFVYSHSSAEAWMAVINAYRSTDFVVSSVQPLSIERKGRPRAISSKAVNTCVTVVARKAHGLKRAIISYDELQDICQEKAIPFGLYLTENLGWVFEDAGMAALAMMVGIISNHSRVTGCVDEKVAIMDLSKVIGARFPGFKVLNRSSL